MNDQLQIVVRPHDDQPTNQVLAVGALLALQWAAPYARTTIGSDGQFVTEPEIDAVGGLLRLDSERTERLRASGREVAHDGESEIHLIEDHKGSWNVPAHIDSWWATGVAIAATSFTATTPTGMAIAETLAISNRSEQRAIELLEHSQTWALQQVDELLRVTADRNPRLLANLLLSLSAKVETLTDTHALLRARYQADIEIIGEHL